MIDQRVEDRVSAYRSNPQALQQKYAVGQDLLDLLALQQIKSEMDSKSRDMQLKMAQQGKKPTIKDQLQQEVVGRTKQDMQQQLVGTMQQEAAEKQKALQQVVQAQDRSQGVAALPAPNMMPTKAMAAGGILDFPDSAEYEQDDGGMASGGIVAFEKGGYAWEKKKTPYDELIDQEARRRGIDPIIFKRLLGSESSFKTDVPSPRGEKYGLGIAQLGEVHGMSREDRLNPMKAIPAAAELFSKYLKRAAGDYEKALQMYKGASSEGGKQRMAGPIRRILEGFIPSAEAGDVPTKTGIAAALPNDKRPTKPYPEGARGTVVDPTATPQPEPVTPKPAVTRGVQLKAEPAEDEAVYTPEGVYMYGPEPKPYKPKPSGGRVGEIYDPITRGIKQGVSEFFQGKPAAPPPAVDANKAQPTGRIGAYGVPEDQFPLMSDQEMMARRQIGVGSAEGPEPSEQPLAPPIPAPAPAPAPTPAAGIASVVPTEYKPLASKQSQVLGDLLYTDPEEMRRARAMEQYESVGKPTELAAAEKAKRLAGLEALDAEQLKRARDMQLTEALLGARGSTWQQALGSAGSAGLAAERRAAETQRQRLVEANTAKDALAEIGLGVKRDKYTAGIGALKEGQDIQKSVLTEAGLAVGRGMSAETARITNEATNRANQLYQNAQLIAAKTQNEGLRQARLEAARAQTIRAVITPLQTALNKMQENYSTLSGGKLNPQQIADLKALEKTIELKNTEIQDRFEKLMVGNDGGDTNAGYSFERIK